MLEVAHAHGVLHAQEATPRLGGHVGWVSAVAREEEEVVVCGLPLVHEALAHAGDSVSSKGEGQTHAVSMGCGRMGGQGS